MRRRPASPPTAAPPTVPDLVDAPELAAIILLEHARDVAADALVAEHMTLIDDFHNPRQQGPVVLARPSHPPAPQRFGGALRALRRRRRRRAASAAADNAPDDDF